MFDTLSPAGKIAAALIAPPGSDVIAALESVPYDDLAASAAADLLVAWERQAAWEGQFLFRLQGGEIIGGQLAAGIEQRRARGGHFHALGVAPGTRLGADGFTRPASMGQPILDLL